MYSKHNFVWSSKSLLIIGNSCVHNAQQLNHNSSLAEMSTTGITCTVTAQCTRNVVHMMRALTTE